MFAGVYGARPGLAWWGQFYPQGLVRDGVAKDPVEDNDEEVRCKRVALKYSDTEVKGLR